jgi:hypothetical protein
LQQEDTSMSRSVDLPDSVYAALQEAAAESSTTPVEWIAAQLPQPAPVAEPPSNGKPPRTLAERLEGRVGLFGSGPRALAERRLPESVYAALEEAALASGTTPAEWVTARLPQHEQEAETACDGQSPLTLADRFEGYLGLVSFEPSDAAARASELFADGMVEKHRDGRL